MSINDRAVYMLGVVEKMVLCEEGISRTLIYYYVHLSSLPTICMPVFACHANRATIETPKARWAFLAQLSPLCMYGTIAAVVVITAISAKPAYKWGPGNSFPARV